MLRVVKDMVTNATVPAAAEEIGLALFLFKRLRNLETTAFSRKGGRGSWRNPLPRIT
jgi:hypothetical protein